MNNKRLVILIVEDDEPSYLYLASILRQIPATIIHAHDGQEAVDFCNDDPEISMVLMDLKMPVMDGFDATRKIKAKRKELPVIVITAFAFSREEKLAAKAGCDEYLTKPVKKEILYKYLEKYGIRTLN